MPEEKEEWRPVVGYEGRYEVSSLGRIRHLKSRKGICYILHPSLDSDGYQIVGLPVKGSDGKTYSRTQKVHKLVAAAFIPNPENKPQIDHINGIKTDNRVINLRWATPLENRNNPATKDNSKASLSLYYGSEKHLAGLRKVAQKMKQRYAKKVLDTSTGDHYDSIHDASKATGVGRKEISLSCKRAANNDYHKHKITGIPVKNRFHFYTEQ